jgi:hypothetical protein
MIDFDFKEEIKKLLKGKREENYLFYYGERSVRILVSNFFTVS